MHSASELMFSSFNESCFSKLSDSRQARYLYCYLRDLGAQGVLEEPHYFDKDYLSEFAAFYSVSSRGYPNTCQRLHFFSVPITRELFTQAVCEQQAAMDILRESYLGFSVLRPITAAPLGCTVLAWYPDDAQSSRRVTEPSRHYECHIAGLTLRVNGLAWQQQDAAVGACATIGLWSMLHASSFDNDHTAPTTAQITEAANQTAVTGARVFPSDGLTIIQLLEAIKRYRLAPFAMSGDIKSAGRPGSERTPWAATAGFSRERFASTCASFIRSGYPVLAIGQSVGVGRHAVCITGFREAAPVASRVVSVAAADNAIRHVYIHDDNLGPNVRFAVTGNSKYGQVMLVADPPDEKKTGKNVSPTLNHPPFIPEQLVICTHEELRTSPDRLNKKGLEIGAIFCQEMNTLLERSGHEKRGALYSCRFMLAQDYLGHELGGMFRANATRMLLGRIRMELTEKVVPMSKFIGVVRLSLSDGTPLLDVLYDTSDSDLNHPVFAHLSYGLNVSRIVEGISAFTNDRLGPQVKAFGTGD